MISHHDLAIALVKGLFGDLAQLLSILADFTNGYGNGGVSVVAVDNHPRNRY
jgi:hypothetical protein